MDFRSQVKESFSLCKADIKSIILENSNLTKKVIALEKENKDLNESISKLNSRLKEIEVALNYFMKVKTEERKEKIYGENEQNSYDSLLSFKAKANKKEILKQKLISVISESGITLSELKFLFVNHYRYCSKATFYNYIKELEYEKYIVQKRENSKTFVYLLNTIENKY